MPHRELKVLAFVKEDHQRFIFLFDDEPESAQQLSQTIGRMAADPELTLTWHDAALLSKKARDLRS